MKKIKKGDIGKLVEWGYGAFDIVMKNNLVVSGCFLGQGISYVLDPRKSVLSSARTLTLYLAIYAVVSIILIITNYSKIVSMGHEMMGDMLLGTIRGKRKAKAKAMELIPDKHKAKLPRANINVEESNAELDAKFKKSEEKIKGVKSKGKILVILAYLLITAAAVVLYILDNLSVVIVNITIGVIIIVHGVSNLVSALRIKDGVKLKNKKLSVFTSVFSILLGIMFIVLAWRTAVAMFRIIGAMLIVKSLLEFFVVIRNREILSSAKGTINDIKNQNKDKEKDKDKAAEDENKESAEE